METVESRWWVDSATGRARSPERKPRRADGDEPGISIPRIAGERLFRVGRHFDQDRALALLTNPNEHWLRDANPPEDGWAYLQAAEERSRDDLLQRVKHFIRLPRAARGVIVDSGSNSLRVVVTGTPVGERVVELTLGGDCSLDAWAEGEWVGEHLFRGRDRALREASGLIARHLAPAEA